MTSIVITINTPVSKNYNPDSAMIVYLINTNKSANQVYDYLISKLFMFIDSYTRYNNNLNEKSYRYNLLSEGMIGYDESLKSYEEAQKEQLDFIKNNVFLVVEGLTISIYSFLDNLKINNFTVDSLDNWVKQIKSVTGYDKEL